MTVQTRPDDTPAPLAGSGPINTTGGASERAETPLIDPDESRGQDGASGAWSRQSEARMPSRDRLAWVCDRCERQLRGSMGELSGFVVVDLRETDAAAKGMLRGPDGPAKARWRTYHARCFPEALRPMNPYFRLWTHRVQSVDDLLDAVAELSRLPWFGFSDWGGSLVKKVIADTGKTIDESVALREQRAQRRRRNAREARELPPDDPRHGKDAGYHAGCGCDSCRAAHAEAARRTKAKRKVRS